MATAARAEEVDTLSSLEERILKAVQLVALLREEKDEALRKLDAIQGESNASGKAMTKLETENARLREELESLKADRKQVRTRIEKLLGQMDLLAAK